VVLLPALMPQVFFSSTATVWQAVMWDFAFSPHRERTGLWTWDLLQQQARHYPSTAFGDTLLAGRLPPGLWTSPTLSVGCSLTTQHLGITDWHFQKLCNSYASDPHRIHRR